LKLKQKKVKCNYSLGWFISSICDARKGHL